MTRALLFSSSPGERPLLATLEERGGAVGQAAVYVWPLDPRPRDLPGRYGSLHDKAAVADSRVAFISSANLTGHAMNLNLELGLLATGGELPQRLVGQLTRLVAEGTLCPSTPAGRA